MMLYRNVFPLGLASLCPGLLTGGYDSGILIAKSMSVQTEIVERGQCW